MNSNNLSKQELLKVFEKAIVLSDGVIISISDFKNRFNIVVKFDEDEYNLNFDLRNIGSAYLPNKPFIFRRQVSSFSIDDFPKNLGNNLSLLVGIRLIENSFVIVAWNPFYFLGHKTNRSCYVYKDSMLSAYTNGYYSGDDCKTPVYACASNNLLTLLKEFKENNTI